MSAPGNARRRETSRTSRASRRRSGGTTLARARKAARQALDAVIARVLARKPLEDDEVAAISADVAPRGFFRSSMEANGSGNVYEVRRHVGKSQRGRTTMADRDRADLDFAVRELVAARAAVLGAHDLPAETPEQRREKREASRSAVAKLALSARMLDEIVMNHNGELR